MLEIIVSTTSNWLKNRLTQLDEQLTGIILAKYNHSLLFKLSESELIHITNTSKNISPFSMYIEGFKPDDISESAAIKCDKNTLYLERFIIKITEDTYTYNESIYTDLEFCNYKIPNNIKTSNIFMESFLKTRDTLLDAYVLNTRLDLIFNMKQLLGSGEGSTPAGDDYLIGFIYGLFIKKRSDILALIKDILLTDPMNSTNLLSHTFLNHAINGRFSRNITEHNWDDLFQSGYTSGFFTSLGISDSVNNHIQEHCLL